MMQTFIQNILRFFILPFAISIAFFIPYYTADPYMDFGDNHLCSLKYSFQTLGDVSTKKLMVSDEAYNSFIMGSSRTTGLYACYLNTQIPNANFFHYGQFYESIRGIYGKLRLLDSLGYSIDNVVLYFDTDCTFLGERYTSRTNHYLVSGKPRFNYLASHFITYYRNPSLNKVNILLGKKASSEIYLNWQSDVTTNDANHICSDSMVILGYSDIMKNAEYKHRIDSLATNGFFEQRSKFQQRIVDAQISEAEMHVLEKIKKLFKKHGSNYFVVLTPLYDQIKFNLEDEILLQEIFGSRVFDFSGINPFTNDVYNYPDKKHFQPYISKIIADSILGE
ncbi:MAG: hypothetical protein ACI9NN_000029 [Bacteroidia bacterium]|jgi:hypothetical protein